MNSPVLTSISLLLCGNVLMAFAHSAHLKALSHKPWLLAAMISWGIILFAYLLQVHANRIGYTALSVGQLKIIQELKTLSVFVSFSVYYLREPLQLDYLRAGHSVGMKHNNLSMYNSNGGLRRLSSFENNLKSGYCASNPPYNSALFKLISFHTILRPVYFMFREKL